MHSLDTKFDETSISDNKALSLIIDENIINQFLFTYNKARNLISLRNMLSNDPKM